MILVSKDQVRTYHGQPSDVAHTGKRASASRAAEQQSTTEPRAPVVPEQYAGASQQAYLAGFKVT